MLSDQKDGDSVHHKRLQVTRDYWQLEDQPSPDTTGNAPAAASKLVVVPNLSLFPSKAAQPSHAAIPVFRLTRFRSQVEIKRIAPRLNCGAQIGLLWIGVSLRRNDAPARRTSRADDFISTAASVTT